MNTPRLSILTAAFLTATFAHADIIIRADQPGPRISPMLYGAFFEEINRAGDGGLYAEMLQNRSFEDTSTAIAWTPLNADTKLTLDKTQPLNPNNPTSLRLEIAPGQTAGIVNQGFKGVPLHAKQYIEPAVSEWPARFAAAAAKSKSGVAVQAGKTYDFSLFARAAAGFRGPLTVSIQKQDGTVLASADLTGLGAAWKKFPATLVAKATDPDARLVVSTKAPGTVWLDMVSLFPRDTYKGRPNGLRPDLVEMIAAMRPAFFRFPGGSYIEGVNLNDAYRWKETLGPVEARPGHWNIWGYRSTDGLGYHEYLQLCEDLGAVPLYVANCGMGEKEFATGKDLDGWLQDALDAIEYANGPVTSKWGALRARNGHPAPFHLKYVEIGNENGVGYHWGGGKRGDYLPRYKVFYDAIKARHPDIITIANIDTRPDVPAEIVDEHYYPNAEWFYKNATRYDKTDRKGPQIYLGEFAVKGDGGNGNLRAALGEAAFMTGLERNADITTMSCYAPLFVHPEWKKWTPNAITFDSSRAYGSPSYYVQVLFGANRGDVNLPVELPVATTPIPTLFAVAGGTKEGDLILKVVNASSEPVTEALKIPGLTGRYPAGTATVLTGPDLAAENTFTEPARIAPKISQLPAYTPGYQHTFPAHSVTILRWTKK